MAPTSPYYYYTVGLPTHSFPIFQARICAWFESSFFAVVTNCTRTLPGTKQQISLLRLFLMSGLLPDKVLNICLHNPMYERDGFKMWGRILKEYDPRGKDALFKSVSALYILDQTQDYYISDYMSRSRCLFSGLHGITFNNMTNIFIIVNSGRSRYGALADRLHAGNLEVVNTDIDRLETLLEAIESRSCVVGGLPTTEPSALRGSTLKSETTPVPPPNSGHPKTTAPPGGAQSSYPPMHPKCNDVNDLSKADNV